MNDFARTRAPGRDRHGDLHDNLDEPSFGTSSLGEGLTGAIGDQFSDAVPDGTSRPFDVPQSRSPSPAAEASAGEYMGDGGNPETAGDQPKESSERQLNLVAKPVEAVQSIAPSVIEDDDAKSDIDATGTAKTGASDVSGALDLDVVVSEPAAEPEPSSLDSNKAKGLAAAVPTTSAEDTGVVNATSPGSDLSLIQPVLVLNHTVVMSGTGSGVIRTFGFNFNPGGHGDTNDTLRASTSFSVLASELGSIHGGDGSSTFGLPDLSGRLAVGSGSGPGLTTRAQGDEFGTNTIDLELGDLPASRGGNGDPIPITSASTTIVYAVATTGFFPSRSAEPFDDDDKVDQASSIEGFIGEIRAFASLDAVPDTGWAIADGTLLPINANQALFSLVGTAFGGDGRTTFALPDLQGRVPVHVGTGPGLSRVNWGQRIGDETHTLSVAETPSPVGSDNPFDIHQPSLGVYHIIALTGLFPSPGSEGGTPGDLGGEPILGEIKMFAGNFPPRGWAFLDGQTLPIAQNTALFSLLGTTYGGDGRSTFSLPDLRGRAIVDEGSGFPIGAQLGSAFETVTTADVVDLFEANSLIVTTTADVIDPLDQETSLREAITFANGQVGADTITFADGAGEVFENGALIRLTQGEITITEELTIDGAGNVTITGDADDDDVTTDGDITDVSASFGGTPGAVDDFLDDNSRIFNVASATAPTPAPTTLIGLTLTGGRTVADAASGGAIASDSELTLIDSAVNGNSTYGDDALGGGVFTNLQSVTLRSSTISNNHTTGDNASGGGVNGDQIVATNSTISGNRTSGNGADGAGLFGRLVTLINGTVSGNQTTGDDADGGGVRGSLLITAIQSTVVGNATLGTDSDGGGIHREGTSGQGTTLLNSIVQGNVALNGSGNDIQNLGVGSQIGQNVVGTDLFNGSTDIADVTVGQIFDATFDNNGTEAGALADNGGTVQTVALLASLSNPVVDQGTGALPTEQALNIDLNGDGTIDGTSITTDARGFNRDVEIPGVGATPDIGAFEIQITPTAGPDILLGTTGEDVQQGLNGNDLFVSSAGADSIDGGADHDVLSYANQAVIGGGAFGIFVDLGNNMGVGNDAEGDTFTNIEEVIDTGDRDIIFGTSGSNTLRGGDQFDQLGGADGGTADTLDGGGGFDIVDYQTATTSFVVDLADHTSGANAGEHTADVWIDIEGIFGVQDFTNEFIGSNAPLEYLIGGGMGDTINGNGGRDFLFGLGGDDTIDGGTDSDLLFAGGGTDTLTGGTGQDVFYIEQNNGIDIITDWSEVDDFLLFFQTGVSGFADLTFMDTNPGAGGNIEITSTVDPSFTVVVENVELTDLDDTGHFVFA